MLCEKPFTVNAAQAKHLQIVAKERNVFLMEGVWTRFFPLTIAFKRMLHEERIIGKVHRVFSDFSVLFDPARDLRMYRADTAGGALLDLGVYMNVWTLLSCYHHPDNELSPPTVLKASMLRSPICPEIDESTTVITVWEKPQIMCIGTASMMTDSPADCVIRIQGTKGEIVIPIHGSRPEKILVKLKGNGMDTCTLEYPIPGQGLFWEADAVARDIRDGKKEDENYPLDESVFAMSLMDEVRRQNNMNFPADIEFVEDY